MRLRWKLTIGLALAVVALLGLRIACARHEVPAPGVPRPTAEAISPAVLASQVITTADLALSLRSRRVLLVGENHFKQEPPRFLGQVLDRLDDREIVLLLELPHGMNEHILNFVDTGDERVLASMHDEHEGLPLDDILRWAHRNRGRVLAIRAIDESDTERFIHRMFLHDTRNETMAVAIVAAYGRYPDARIVVYGGLLHMLMAGRYRYDIPNREPAGSRLPGKGIDRGDIASVVVGGEGTFPLGEVWSEPGALPVRGDVAELHFAYFIDYPIFGTHRAGDLFDFFVNLGSLTPAREH